MFERLWIQILAPYTGWTLYCLFEKTKKKQKRGRSLARFFKKVWKLNKKRSTICFRQSNKVWEVSIATAEQKQLWKSSSSASEAIATAAATTTTLTAAAEAVPTTAATPETMNRQRHRHSNRHSINNNTSNNNRPHQGATQDGTIIITTTITATPRTVPRINAQHSTNQTFNYTSKTPTNSYYENDLFVKIKKCWRFFVHIERAEFGVVVVVVGVIVVGDVVVVVVVVLQVRAVERAFPTSRWAMQLTRRCRGNVWRVVLCYFKLW